MGEVKITFSLVPRIYKCAKIHNWGIAVVLNKRSTTFLRKIRNDITTSNKEYSVIGFTCLKTGSATIETTKLLHLSVMFLSKSAIAKLIKRVTLN